MRPLRSSIRVVSAGNGFGPLRAAAFLLSRILGIRMAPASKGCLSYSRPPGTTGGPSPTQTGSAPTAAAPARAGVRTG